MGNCVGSKKNSSMEECEWDDDFWRLDDDPQDHIFTRKKEEELLGDQKQGIASNASTGTELKIKISKKQLEKILGTAHVENMPLEKLLAQLMEHDLHLRNQPWKPSLQSIPEVN